MTQQSNNLTDNSFNHYFFNYFSFSFDFYIKNGEKCVRKTYKGRGGLFETCESVQGKIMGGGGRGRGVGKGSKIATFERTHFLNDP